MRARFFVIVFQSADRIFNNPRKKYAGIASETTDFRVQSLTSLQTIYLTKSVEKLGYTGKAQILVKGNTAKKLICFLKTTNVTFNITFAFPFLPKSDFSDTHVRRTSFNLSDFNIVGLITIYFKNTCKEGLS